MERAPRRGARFLFVLPTWGTLDSMFTVALSLVVGFAPLDLSDESVARGNDRTLSVQLGAEGGAVPWMSAAAFHGIVRLRYVEDALIPGRGLVDVDLNTDTLSLAYAHPDLFGPWTYVRAYTRLQAFAANLLTDHVRAGVIDDRRGFGSAYALVGAMVAVSPVHDARSFVSLRASVEARQWAHFPWMGTSDDLVLPPSSQSVEPAFAFFAQSGRRATRMLRLDGFESMGEGRVYLQNGRAPWGALAGASDGRNDATEPFAFRVEGGARTGSVSSSIVGLRAVSLLAVRAGTGAFLDDRTRFMVGGENPYVVPMAGAAWAEFLADRYALLEARQGVMFFERVVVDVGAHAAVVNDVKRTGALDAHGALGGVFVEGEARVTDDVLVRGRYAYAVIAPRRDPEFGKLFLLVEWRPLPWSW